ncbi:helix-turn-helix domain-containing protein [Aliiroseovarius sediminis]|uniref:helix-turn-helix domain-containing protein n=1 Tax=Aliiroseovarius sediminis TaxID=2925839 RepID=UPI001F5667AA|nr:helix-turn-helix domain-containing protein [Aliiroseovarius sediminis]MCI2395607.1 hypothetical protein [Aliiroseovarius sediminis]
MTQALTHNGLPAGLTRWQFFGLIQTARRQLGLSKGAISYLKVAIGCTQDEDFTAGRICAFWTSVTKTACRAEMDRRQVARIEAELIERGFLGKSASKHSRRNGSRKNGAIGHEFGINLAPLINRVSEIQAAARKAVFEEEEAERLRGRIRKLFGDIRKLQIDDACEAATDVLPNNRPSTIQSFERLKQVVAALEAVWKEFSTENGRGEMSHQCDISPPLNTGKEKKYKTCRAEKARHPQPVRITPSLAMLLAGAEFQEIIGFYAGGAAGGPPDWRSMEMAARDRAHQLGVSTGVWQRQCEILGSERAVLCLLVADHNAGRADKYTVRDAAGAFVNMVRSEAAQKAVLDRLLGELIGFAKGQHNV